MPDIPDPEKPEKKQYSLIEVIAEIRRQYEAENGPWVPEDWELFP